MNLRNHFSTTQLFDFFPCFKWVIMIFPLSLRNPFHPSTLILFLMSQSHFPVDEQVKMDWDNWRNKKNESRNSFCIFSLNTLFGTEEKGRNLTFRLKGWRSRFWPLVSWPDGQTFSFYLRLSLTLFWFCCELRELKADGKRRQWIYRVGVLLSLSLSKKLFESLRGWMEGAKLRPGEEERWWNLLAQNLSKMYFLFSALFSCEKNRKVGPMLYAE